MRNSYKKETLGETLKQKRESLGVSYEEIETEIKIKPQYLRDLENEDFERFSSVTQLKGFLKLYSKFLGLNSERILALYRRDYENLELKRELKTEKKYEFTEQKEFKAKSKLFDKVIITRRKLVFAASLLVTSIFLLFVINIIKMAFNPPYLEITSPIEIKGEYSGNVEYANDQVKILGKTAEGVLIKANSIPLSLNPAYEFETPSFPVTEKETKIVIEAQNNLGRKTKMEINFIKPNEDIGEMNLVFKVNKNSFVRIKADEVVVLEQELQAGHEVELHAVKYFEIETLNYSDAEITINNSEYKLNSEGTIFENKGDRIEQREI